MSLPTSQVLRDGNITELHLDKLHPQVALVPVHLFNSKYQVESVESVRGSPKTGGGVGGN